MAGLVRRVNRRRRSAGSRGCCGLGGLGGDVFSTIVDAAGTALNVATDPYLPELICRVRQLYQVENSQKVLPCNKLPLTLVGGIGLRQAIVPLRGYVYAQQHKWVYAAAAALLIGVPLFVGYEIGKAK